VSVHKKLMQARVMLQARKLNKSGHNKFAGYKYFELGDFIPAVQEIFHEIGLCGTVSFFIDVANLVITDTDDFTQITLVSPMSIAQLKGCHEVQNLGAVQTYIRRYLWVSAMEIVEHDALDAVTGSEPEPEKKLEPKKETKPIKIEGKDASWTISIQEKEPGAWVGEMVKSVDGLLVFAETPEDVKSIFRVNKNIFDKLKAEHPEVYDALMNKLGEYKKNLNKE